MIRAFVALSLIVLALLVYAVKGGVWDNSPKVTHAPASHSVAENSADDLGLTEQSETTARARLGLTDLDESPARKDANPPTGDSDAREHALREAQLSIKNETNIALERARAEARENSKQLTARIAEVQGSANEKIAKVEWLLEQTRSANKELENKNRRLESIRTQANAATEEALKAVQSVQQAVQKANAMLQAEAAAVPQKSRTDIVIRTLEDAKALTDPENGAARRVGPREARVATTERPGVERDPVTGFPVTHGYSFTKGDKSTIFFSFSSHALSDSARAALKRLVSRDERGGARYRLTTFSDGSGAAKANSLINSRREEEVRRYLLSLGVPGDAVPPAATAEVEKLDDNSPLTRMRNRRIEVVRE